MHIQMYKKLLVLCLLEDEEELALLLILMFRNEYAHSREWCNLYVSESLDIQFHNNFKMTKTEFTSIVQIIHNTSPQLTIGFIKESLFIFIYYSTRTITYRDIGDKFGRSTHYCRHCIKTIARIFYGLRSTYICLPAETEYAALDTTWQTYSELKGTILAVDGTHISISALNQNQERYIDRHSDYSINYLITCDGNEKIRHVFGPGYGSSHDAFLFSISSLKEWIENEVPMGYHVIADSAFPAAYNCLVPIKGNLTPEEKI
ncbi:hypothetical protein ENBRE01_3511, partial [Enteropsectra breve]